MARIISIDYGKKRTGLAVTDPMQIIATALDVVESEKLVNYLKSYFAKESVERIILGFPKNLKNEDTEMTPLVRELAERLKTVFPSIPLQLYDERFTTAIANRSMIESGMSKKDRQTKGNSDKISATILLQDYLSSKR